MFCVESIIFGFREIQDRERKKGRERETEWERGRDKYRERETEGERVKENIKDI